MKRCFYSMLVWGLLLWNCSEEEGPDAIMLTLSKDYVEVSAEESLFLVEVESNVTYVVDIPQVYRSWISEEELAEKTEGTQTHRFRVAANDEPETRGGYIVFLAGDLSDTVFVSQTGVLGADFTEKKIDGFLFDMVYVQGGTFDMGATEEQGDEAWDYEIPVHSVTLSAYYIGKYEVTQGLWEKVMGTTLEEQRDLADKDGLLHGVGADYPMYYVSWSEAQEFVQKLSDLTGRNYMLPTEAQWEYAARGGAKSKGYKYAGSNEADEVAWYDVEESHVVGGKVPNELGLYDMSGNVWEWCRDWYGDYEDAAQTDPTGPESNSFWHVVRGGGWNRDASFCRVSHRNYLDLNYRFDYLGFRVVLIP